MHYCHHCDYKSKRRADVIRHEASKHKQNNQVYRTTVQLPTPWKQPQAQNQNQILPNHPQLKTSYMQGYPQQQQLWGAQNHYLQNNDAQSVSMETDGHPQDFLSESDSEESEIDVGPELADIITDIDNSFNYIIKLRKPYLKALEKYDQIEDEDKRDIFKKYVRLKGKIYGEWYDMKEGYKVKQEQGQDNEEEQDNEEAQDNEEELEEEQEEEEDNEEEQGGDDEQEGEEQEGGGEEDDRNHLMSFVLELESVAGEDDKAYIERLWKKRWDLVKDLKETQIDERDTDPDTDKGED